MKAWEFEKVRKSLANYLEKWPVSGHVAEGVKWDKSGWRWKTTGYHMYLVGPCGEFISKSDWESFKKDAASHIKWEGEDLPPVGTVCEVECTAGNFQCEIAAHFMQPECEVAAYTVENPDTGWKTLNYARPERFRPILSDEDKAVAAMVAVTDEHLSPEDTCRALYRAGYRKQ